MPHCASATRRSDGPCKPQEEVITATLVIIVAVEIMIAKVIIDNMNH